MWIGYVALVLFIIWVLMNFKTSRPDGTLIKTHPYRRMMFFLFPTRNESVVYFDDYVPSEKLEAFISEANKATAANAALSADERRELGVSITHMVATAFLTAVSASPGMNRFTVGRRLYQRNEHVASFSMKRKKLDGSSKISVVKLAAAPGEGFGSYIRRINKSIKVERSDKQTYTDKELNLFLRLPRFILNKAIPLMFWLDYHNCLPGSFIKNDVMYTSGFIANLGSVHMKAGYHHLYEWGTCPLFIMVGKLEELPVAEDGKVVSKRMIHIRFSYDERIDDGLTAGLGINALHAILADPYRFYGHPTDADFGAAEVLLKPGDPRADGCDKVNV